MDGQGPAVQTDAVTLLGSSFSAMFSTRRRFVTLVSGSLALGGLAAGLPALARDEAAPNVFISPHGRPYRAPARAPYPVVDWFKAADRNGDGKLDRDEFVADAAAFFAFLDQRGDGELDAQEVAYYEHRIAPEVLGMRVTVYADGRMRVTPGAAGAGPGQPRLWLAQYGQYGQNPERNGAPGPDEGGPWGQDGQGPNGPVGPGTGYHGDPSEGGVVPQDALPHSPTAQDPNAAFGTGAAPYSLFRDPEPVTAADRDYVIDAKVRKAEFIARANENFAALDRARRGYLMLDDLPQTPVQRLLLARG